MATRGRERARPAASRLLEREGELAAVDAAVEGSRRGAGGALLIEGPAGIGKTAVLQAACDRARGAGLLVLSGAGRELEQGFAFGVARQLLEPALRELPPAEREEALSGAAAPAEALLGRRAVEVRAQDAAFALTHAVYWVVANLAERRPLLLAVDDVHRADSPSGRALAYLVARVEELAALVVCTVHTGEPAWEGLHALRSRDAPVRILEPAPLSLAATSGVVRAAIGTGASDTLCRACHQATGGNPFLARELALAAAAEGEAARGGEISWLGELAPATVARAILPRIRALGAAARELARSVAVLESTELRHAAALAELQEAGATEAADALVRAGILAPGPPFRFAHPVLRAVVYEDLGPASRERAHRRSAELLVRADGDPRAVSSHLLRTEPRGEAWAMEALRADGLRAFASGAPAAAVRALRRALDEGVERARPELLQELGRAEAACGDPGAADHLEAAHETAASPESRARAMAALAEMRFARGELALAVQGFRHALAELEQDPGTALEPGTFLGYVMLARAFAPSAGEARDLIGRHADGVPRLDAARLAAVAYDGFLRGRPAEEVCEAAALALADGNLLEAGGPATQAFFLTTWALAGADGFEAAEQALARAFGLASRSGSFLTFGMACHHRLWSRWRRGQIPQALADAEVALELAELGWFLLRPAAAWARAECLIETGDLAGAADEIDRAEPLEPGLAGSCVEGWYLMGRSRLALERGDAPTALDEALRCGAILTALHAENPAVAEWRARAALAAAALGDHGRARELWEEELALARSFGAPRAIGIALRTAGVVEGGREGIALLREATGVLGDSPALLERARALTELGAALRRARQPTEAREPLAHALSLAGDCGAAALAGRARDELLAAGARPRRSATHGLESLTPRELRIAELAADGLGNREIAQALFVTRKTVEAHMRNVFRKLGIGARAELAELLRSR